MVVFSGYPRCYTEDEIGQRATPVVTHQDHQKGGGGKWNAHTLRISLTNDGFRYLVRSFII